MADNKVQNSIDAVRKGLREILADMEAIDKKIIATATNAQKIGTGLKANAPDGLTKILTQQNELLQKMNGLLDTQTSNTNKLNTSRRTLKNLSAEEVVNQRKLAKNADLQAKATSGLVGAYDRLNAKYQQSKQRLNDLNASHSATRREVRSAELAFKKYQDRINQVNRATSNFSKNSLGGMVRGFRNLLGAFGLVGGVSLLAKVSKDVYGLTRQLESLGFALKTVTKTQEQFAVAQNFLLDISERYGVNLISTTERYTKFLAAANQSNLALSDTERIFESVTKASAVLGLKTDELTGVYLALEQMISKGKVTTEELRRQLGERLPGAFGIMADALGVSIRQLDDMLKKGEVLSSEALPKFATALQKAYGIEAVTTVDTLTASQNKLTTAWIKFVSAIEGSEGKISSVLKGALQAMTNFIDGLTEFNRTGYDTASKVVDDFKRSTRAANQEVKTFIVESLQATDSAISNNRKELEKLLDSPLIKQAKNGQIQFFGVGSSEEAERARFLQEEINRQIEIRSGLTNELNKEEQRRKMLIQQAIDLSIKYSEQQGNEINLENQKKEINSLATLEVEKRIKLLRSLVHEEEIDNETKKKGIEALRGSIAFMEQYIKKLEEERSKLATNTEAYSDYTQQIEAAESALLKLRHELENPRVKVEAKDFIDLEGLENLDINRMIQGLDSSSPEDSTTLFQFMKKASKDALGDIKSDMDELEQYQDDKNKAQAASYMRYMETTRMVTESIFETFSDLYDLDLQNFEFLYDKKKNTINDWAVLSKDVIGSVLDASLNRYEIELQEAQRSRDLIVNNELATEKEKRLAREKFEEEERRIKTKRAKQERTNTLIKIAVDTAAASAAALAPPPVGYGPVVGLGFIPLIAGLGLAQAALVASQPLPKFAEGTRSPLADDTLAWVGDGGRKEAITKGGKLLDISPDRPTLAMLPKGAEVHKDAGEWINNAIYKMNMSANGELLSSIDADYILHNEIRKMRQDSKRTWEEVKRLANRPVSVNNRVVIEKETEYRQ